MKTREKGYKDYGFDKEEAEKLKAYCRDGTFSDHSSLLQAAICSNPEIAGDLFYTLLNGISYEKLSKIKYVPISLVDFYAYQRKCLYMFRNLLMFYGKWN